MINHSANDKWKNGGNSVQKVSKKNYSICAVLCQNRAVL